MMLEQGFDFVLRRDRDSNPGNLSVQRFSRPPQSTTLPPLHFCFCQQLSLNCGAKLAIDFYSANVLSLFFSKNTNFFSA